ncbi:tripartite motif-containing 13 isoform X3 [Oncorhynchus tshawytscha]|nr:tripartite motif-containing 13 isoform X3 [Oncorhynchus tshawytscha]XP_024245078.1 tripartite motif-containing 13 isoform X3 [Oncorhynchus tshawytscha]XP_024245079.1 tripartite motif-containing 13 isoform X3 [Oncorhynchus tshawytscha]
MELLEEDLTCPICCCLFEDPRVLPCSHSFCKKCLEGILEGNNRGPVWRPPFKCPSCRKETPQNGINTLQINYSLRGIVEKYNKIRLLPRMVLCKHHSGQPLNIFCATDFKLICGFCITTGDHKGHKFCALEDAYEQEKAAFEELFQGVENWRSADTITCLETLEASKKNALQLVSRDAEKVMDYFVKLISTLDHKKNEILSDFETLKLVVMQAYDPEINKLSAALEEQRRAVSIAESFRNVTDPFCFLQQMQEFREKLRVVRETTLPSRIDMDVGHMVRNFDVKNWDSVKLKDVDKLSVPQESSAYCSTTQRVSGRTLGRVIVIVVCLLLYALVLPQLDSLTVVSAQVSSLCHSCLPVLSGWLEMATGAWQCWREVVDAWWVRG